MNLYSKVEIPMKTKATVAKYTRSTKVNPSKTKANPCTTDRPPIQTTITGVLPTTESQIYSQLINSKNLLRKPDPGWCVICACRLFFSALS